MNFTDFDLVGRCLEPATSRQIGLGRGRCGGEALAWLGWLCCLVVVAAGPATPTSAAEHCQLAPVRELAVEVKAGRVEVTGSVNRHDTRLMLDTGSDASYVMQTLAIELELPRMALPAFAVFPSGIKPIERAHVQEISVGGMSGSSMDLTVIADGVDSEGFGMLVGANFLMQTDVEFNLPARRLVFYRPEHCEHANLAYWNKEPEVVASRDASVRDRRQMFTVLVNGQPVTAMIDSGAPGTSLDLDAAKRLGLNLNSPGAVAPPADQPKGEVEFVVPIESIEIGDETIKRDRVAVIDFQHGNKSETAMMNPEGGEVRSDPDLLLGLDFLLRHRVMFAVKEHKIFFTYEPLLPAAAAR